MDVWYCPNCGSVLPGGKGTLCCPDCAADFGATAVWGPITSKNPDAEHREQRSLPLGILSLIGRSVVVGLAFVVSLVLVILSAIPYGGGSVELILLMWVVLIVGIVWAAFPLARAVSLRIYDAYNSRSRAQE